jgi:hypothetical protein
VWFDEIVTTTGSDIVIYMQRPEPVHGVRCEEFPTIVIDLTQEPDELLGAMPKDTRYEIRRAEGKDGILYESWREARQAFEAFCDTYDEFAALKKLPHANRTRLHGFLEANALDLSCVRSPDLQYLVWHAYYRSRARARLLLSASLYRAEQDSTQRSLVGRANRYHHWRDMLRFKEAGATVYDFGGWYAGNTDAEMLGINRFKETFGGSVVVHYTGQQLMTPKARLAATLNKVLRR